VSSAQRNRAASPVSSAGSISSINFYGTTHGVPCFGYGAGAYNKLRFLAFNYAAAEMALFKIVFEFGLVGALAYFGFLFSCLFSSRARDC